MIVKIIKLVSKEIVNDDAKKVSKEIVNDDAKKNQIKSRKKRKLLKTCLINKLKKF